MPIYEYTCQQCDHRFETIVFPNDGDEVVCPQCNSVQVKKLVSAGAIRPEGIPTGSGGFKPPACKAG